MDAVSDLQNITMPEGISRVALEASGLLYLPDVGRFVVVSDETERKQPELYLMDTAGYIGNKTTVKNSPLIDDMEGIATDPQGRIHLLTSQSYTRKGNLKPERKLLVRCTRQGTVLQADASVPLIDLLVTAARTAAKSSWAQFILLGVHKQEIDIEGLVWHEDCLLLGFKNPRIGNDALILSISDPDAMFAAKKLSAEQIRIGYRFPIVDTTTGTFCGISDLCFVENRLFGLSTGVQSSSGVATDIGLFWTFHPETGTLQILGRFPDRKPEGLAYTPGNGLFYIVFDNGSKNASQFMTAKVSP
ncbi:MAG: hypothetical protein JW863_16790 [Chitinispirillaceae bacterium]|nr:hypothetical protein [Chitinispirillaceae bacterium]